MTDRSTRVPAPDDPRLRAWKEFLLAHARVIRRLDEEMRAEHDLTLAEYDAILQLATAPDRRLRMSQLADRVLLSRSGVTRLVDRLVADGLVGRDACASDARGSEAVLTERGLARLREASRTHLRGVERYFLSVVPEADRPALEHALGLVAARASAGPTAGSGDAGGSMHADDLLAAAADPIGTVPVGH